MWYLYWKYQNEEHLYYLYKIVYNKSVYEDLLEENEYLLEEKKEEKEYDRFCFFVYNLNYELKKKDNKKDEYKEHEKEDDIYYIYYFLKDYDYLGNLFSNLTFNKLKNYLISEIKY